MKSLQYFISNSIIPALNRSGYQYQGYFMEDLEDGYFFLYKEDAPFMVIIGVDEKELWFTRENIHFHSLRFEDLQGLSQHVLERKIIVVSKRFFCFMPEIPEHWSDYLGRNFY